MKKYGKRKIKRNCQKTKYIYLFAVIILWAAGIGTMVWAGQGEKTIYYESVQIASGDTLWGIAQMYKEENENTEHMVRKIKELNGMFTDDICSGERILVPVVKKQAVEEAKQ